MLSQGHVSTGKWIGDQMTNGIPSINHSLEGSNLKPEKDFTYHVSDPRIHQTVAAKDLLGIRGILFAESGQAHSVLYTEGTEAYLQNKRI